MFIAVEQLLAEIFLLIHLMLKLHFDIRECKLSQIDTTCTAHECSDVRVEQFPALG